MPTIFPVIGMKCSGCAARIGEALTRLPGIERADVSLESGAVTVWCAAERGLLLKVRAKINSLGYGVDDLKMYPDKKGLCRLPQVEG